MVKDKMEEKQKPILYYPDKAIELASSLPELIPVRLFAILYPLWLIETSAEQEFKRPYALIERYIERGIWEGQLQTVEELVGFFSLSADLIQKVLHVLATIQHVQQMNDGRWVLTERGIRSLTEGTKSVRQEKSQILYFDGFYLKPLPQQHYHKMSVVPDGEAETITRAPRGGYQFHRLYSRKLWNPTVLDDLVKHPDRTKYNLPSESRNITLMGQTRVYIPMYIIEARKRSTLQPYYIVYTHVKSYHDEFFEQLVNSCQEVQRALDGMPKEENLLAVWSEWLRSHNLTYLRPEQTVDGLWRVVLPVEVFHSAKFSPIKVGRYYKQQGYFLQLWCNDESIRRQAVLDYTWQLVEKSYKTLTKKRVEELLQQRSILLNVARVGLEDLYRLAKTTSCEKSMLDVVASWYQEKND